MPPNEREFVVQFQDFLKKNWPEEQTHEDYYENVSGLLWVLLCKFFATGEDEDPCCDVPQYLTGPRPNEVIYRVVLEGLEAVLKVHGTLAGINLKSES